MSTSNARLTFAQVMALLHDVDQAWQRLKKSFETDEADAGLPPTREQANEQKQRTLELRLKVEALMDRDTKWAPMTEEQLHALRDEYPVVLTRIGDQSKHWNTIRAKLREAADSASSSGAGGRRRLVFV